MLCIKKALYVEVTSACTKMCMLTEQTIPMNDSLQQRRFYVQVASACTKMWMLTEHTTLMHESLQQRSFHVQAVSACTKTLSQRDLMYSSLEPTPLPLRVSSIPRN